MTDPHRLLMFLWTKEKQMMMMMMMLMLSRPQCLLMMEQTTLTSFYRCFYLEGLEVDEDDIMMSLPV